MNLVNYKFFILKSLSARVYKGYNVDTDNMDIIAVNNPYYFSTKKISTLGYNSIRILSNAATSMYLYEYSATGAYLGFSKVSSGPLTLKADTAYIQFRFYELLDFYNLDTKGFLYAGWQVAPHYKSLSKKAIKESGQEFFRTTLEGKLTIFGKDYEIIQNSSVEDQLVLMIDRPETDLTWSEYFRATFAKTDCKLDYSRKRCELKVSPLDDYTEIINKYENSYDIIKLAPAISKINMNNRPLIQVYIKGSNSITNFVGGTYWETDVLEAVNDHNALVNNYYFAYIQTANEFYIEGASVSSVNGVYAGLDNSWENRNRCICSFELDTTPGASDLEKGRLLLKNSSGTVLYQSLLFYINDSTDINLAETKGYNGLATKITMVNVNDSSDKFTISTVFAYSIYERVLCNVDTITDSEGTKNTYLLPLDDFAVDNRNYKKCIGMSSGFFFCTSRTVDTPTRYGMDDYGRYFTGEFIAPSIGFGRTMPVSRNSWANASLWYVYSISYQYSEKYLRKPYILKNSYAIADVIKALLSKICPQLKHEALPEYSNFLYSDDIPLTNMDRFYVYISPKSNVLKGDYDQASQKAELSLKELMDMLRDCFRCYWYIEDGMLKIEHISFFMNGKSYSSGADSQLNIAEQIDSFNKKPIEYFQSEIEYDKSDLPHRYEFGWMDDATELFGGATIDVESNIVQKDKVEDINISKFSSDVDYMVTNPSSFSSDGFTLLCPIKVNGSLELPMLNMTLVDEDGRSYQAILQNGYASWAYLLRFYVYDMPAFSVKCNVLLELLVRGIKRSMKHSVRIPAKIDFDNFKLITTSVGKGKIDSLTVDMVTQIVSIDLSYTPV